MSRYATCQEIVNRAAVECGLTPVADVFASTDPAFVQLRTLLTSCGQNLTENYEWEILRREFSYTTIECQEYLDHGVVTSGPFVVGETVTGGTSGATGVVVEVGEDYVAIQSVTGAFRVNETITGGTSGASAAVSGIRENGVYNLPDDFDRMIPQTNWDYTNRYPMAGSLSPQQWQYLLGMQLTGQTIYATFRQMEGKFDILPQPPSPGTEIVYEYISTNWIQSSTDPLVFKNEADANDDLVLFKPELVVQFLRFKFFGAKGFPTKLPQDMFAKAYENATSSDKAPPILNAGGRRLRWWTWGIVLVHFLDWNNMPDTGYGLQAQIWQEGLFTVEGNALLTEEGGINFLLQEQNINPVPT